MIKYGFQTYTWQMSYEKYKGKIERILDITKQSGLNAIEAEICMLAHYFDSPEALKSLLTEKGITFAALCLVCDWANDGETPEETVLANKAIEYAFHFPGTMLALCQMPQNDRSNLAERQKNALTCINAVAERAFDSGLVCAFHPNSPAGSVFRTHDDYKLMLDGLHSHYVGFVPDSGHIIKGGMNVYDIFSDYISLIKHVHFKDIRAEGGWCVMGKGITNFEKIIRILNSDGYDGYVMIEDESPDAERSPDAIAVKNAEFIHSKLLE